MPKEGVGNAKEDEEEYDNDEAGEEEYYLILSGGTWREIWLDGGCREEYSGWHEGYGDACGLKTSPIRKSRSFKD